MIEDSEKISQGLISGRSIIEDYKSGKIIAIQKYKQLSNALLQFETWKEESKVNFLSQFIDIYDLLDANCTEIQLKWHIIPKKILRPFIDFYAALALNHIVHLEMVFKAITERFQPEMTVDLSKGEKVMIPALSDEEQEQIYQLAHYCINKIVLCIPLSVNTLLKCCEANYPHHRHPTDQLLAYNRNLILLSENFEFISQGLWSLITDRLISLDVSISAKSYNEDKNPYETEEIFAMDEENLSILKENLNDKNSIETKLDLSMAQIIAYISANYNSFDFLSSYQNDINFKWINTIAKKNLNLFSVMLSAFEQHILYSFDIHSVSYLWFYLCGCSEDNCKSMLLYLWNFIKSPLHSPNDWKKAHNAAALICGFLARANYVSFKTACYWMKLMADWCCAYVDNAGFSKVNVGGIQHGIFYATVQALLFVICYRYHEFHGMGEIHLWGLGRIIHSKLEPLRFISQAVALCFANVSRFLQIVYCSHILCAHETLRNRPIELYFPFSFCTLNLCSPKILPLMRKFVSIEQYSAKLNGTLVK